MIRWGDLKGEDMRYGDGDPRYGDEDLPELPRFNVFASVERFVELEMLSFFRASS